jgi:hypothetical protein
MTLDRVIWFNLTRHDEPPADPPADPPANPPADPPNDLGDAGKKALQEERAARKAAEKLAAEQAAKLKEFEDRDKTEAEKLAAKAEAAEKKATEATARAVKAEVKALADSFADRDDAVLNLGDLGQYVKDGEIDTDAITEALGKVLERKPHLAKPAAPPPRNPAPDPSQGRGGENGPPDFTNGHAVPSSRSSWQSTACGPRSTRDPTSAPTSATGTPHRGRRTRAAPRAGARLRRRLGHHPDRPARAPQIAEQHPDIVSIEITEK